MSKVLWSFSAYFELGINQSYVAQAILHHLIEEGEWMANNLLKRSSIHMQSITMWLRKVDGWLITTRMKFHSHAVLYHLIVEGEWMASKLVKWSSIHILLLQKYPMGLEPLF